MITDATQPMCTRAPTNTQEEGLYIRSKNGVEFNWGGYWKKKRERERKRERKREKREFQYRLTSK